MALYILLSLLLFITLASIFQFNRQRKIKRGECYKLPPGPKKLPIIGNLHQISELPHQSLWLLSKKYGPLMYLQLGHVPALVVSSAAMAKEVLKTHDLDFCSRPKLVATDAFTYGGLDVGFSPYGEYWREIRKIYILELFSVKRVQSFRSVREEEISSMIESISRSSLLPVNVSKLVVSLANNIICRIALGRKCIGEDYGQSRFHRILQEGQALLASFYVGDFFPSMKWIDRLTGIIGKLEKNIGEFDAFYEEVIDEHLNPRRQKPEHEDLVDVLLQLQKDATHLTRIHIKAVLMDMFIAGTETISTMLVWAMSELMRNPNVIRKAQEEVRGFISTKGKVEEDDIQKMTYLKSVVKETMRLHSPVPTLVPRETIRHCRISGYDIPPKTRVFINVWGIGRDPNSWERPEEFFPDRFIDSSLDFKGQDFELLPFGSGRRICPAMLFGTATIELALANLLYFFDWKMPDRVSKEDIDMSVAPGFVLLKKFDLVLVAKNYSMK